MRPRQEWHTFWAAVATVAATAAAAFLAARATSDMPLWPIVAAAVTMSVALLLMVADIRHWGPHQESTRAPRGGIGPTASVAAVGVALIFVLGALHIAGSPRTQAKRGTGGATSTRPAGIPSQHPGKTQGNISIPASPDKATASHTTTPAGSQPAPTSTRVPATTERVGGPTPATKPGTGAGGSATDGGHTPLVPHTHRPTYSAADPTTISRVTFSGTSTDPAVTLEGTQFGTLPEASNSSALDGYTGSDYGNFLYLCDTSSNPHTFCAGQNDGTGHGWDRVGLVVMSYGSTSVQLTLGSSYSDYYFREHIYELQEEDGFTVTIAGVTCAGRVSFRGEPTTCAH